MLDRFLHALAALFVALLPGCAAIDEEIRATRCHYDGAFEQGMNDGRAGRDMSSAFASACDPSRLGDVRAGYRDGYQSGLASRAAERPVVVRGDPRHRAFFCEVTAFGESYAAFGATELEARAAAQARCREKQDEPFCRDPACRPNR